MSLPVRERGLKYTLDLLYVRVPCVAPRAGAWIEISYVYSYIEGSLSLPVRERGLKLHGKASFSCSSRSLPVRERGLKYMRPGIQCSWFPSLPVRERGLKFKILQRHLSCLGRSPCGSVD